MEGFAKCSQPRDLAFMFVRTEPKNMGYVRVKISYGVVRRNRGDATQLALAAHINRGRSVVSGAVQRHDGGIRFSARKIGAGRMCQVMIDVRMGCLDAQLGEFSTYGYAAAQTEKRF